MSSIITSFSNLSSYAITTTFAGTGAIPLTAKLNEFSGGALGTLYVFLTGISSATTIDFKLTVDLAGEAAVVPSPTTAASIEIGTTATKGSIIQAINSLICNMPGDFEPIDGELKLYLWLKTDAGSATANVCHLSLETMPR